MIRAKARSIWLLGGSLLLLGLGGSCTETDETEPFVPPRQGASQPGGGGKKLSEDEACERVREAEEAARVDLQCSDLERPACPYYVRPAGTGCWEFSEESVSACVDKIAAYEDCSDFARSPCILTGTPSGSDCATPGGGGAGGDSSGGGSPGSGGDSSGGTPGAAGADAGGAPGQGGAPGAGAGGAP
jgi:hypothetical protein